VEATRIAREMNPDLQIEGELASPTPHWFRLSDKAKRRGAPLQVMPTC